MSSFTNKNNQETNQDRGLLEVVCGCMFSGKTEELIKLTEQALSVHKEIQVFKPRLDNRYTLDFVVSHSDLRLPCEVIEDASDILKLLKPNTKFVAIDEAQFLDQDIVKIASNLASKGLHVVCSGLDTDWQGRPFHPMPLLMASADIIKKKYATCSKCDAPATRTQRTIESDQNVLIGAGDAYQARCRMHFDPFECIKTTSKHMEASL